MKEKTRWQNLPTQTKMGFIVMGFIQIALLITALRDIRRRPAAEINGPKKIWMAVSFINFLGPITYFIFGHKPVAQLPEEVRTP